MSTGFQGIRTNNPEMLPSRSFLLDRETAEGAVSPVAFQPTGQSAVDASGRIPPKHDAVGPLRIRLFNVKYSPNLGDGLLSECLEKALMTLGASRDTWSIDLAARQVYGDGLAGRLQIMSALDMMPKWLRQQVVRVPLAIQARRKWRPHYSSHIQGAHAVVIGGGNLISDIDLNFPTKLTLAINEAERLSLPFMVYASGVTPDWSPRGTAMLEKAFSNQFLRGVFVRDHDSKRLWDEKLGDASGFEAIVVRDPGLLAADFIPPSRMHHTQFPVAGVGIMSHIAIRYHADNAPEPLYLENWYLDLVRGLVRKGYHVAIFTNGSPEDVAYLAKLRPQLLAIGRDAVSFPVQRTPSELCAIISSLDVLVAYRMHAVIAAYSYGVPAVGLAWDRKLQSFMASVNREEFLCDVAQAGAPVAVELACRAVTEGIPDNERKQVLLEAWQGVSQLLHVLERAP
ncbi:polysaccharide pyruvyl transferase family protein [Pararhizobium sp. BT-229]|uniref:polysaccharide pyruvyl transferase family protein n=1 Tax=Pararhizobium sp. BT-229 TaxID=2986923 RepID=UPI0021F6D611|nr:polysaccharide pyruvyl transferase family protein [Pararhizobium sp. BT-229]MCV9967749.1 polysaccharide pyruvyl transferase family protein [Pararhizobium sp. BT-229]